MSRAPAKTLVLGTRGSKLALVQAETVAGRLRGRGFPVEVRPIKTTAEERPEESLAQIDQRDLFTRQLDEALLRGEIDLAVHSLKDIPTEVPEGIDLVAVPERHEPSDVLVSAERYTLETLPEGALVATSSLRRRAQLLNRRPDLVVVEIRGNVDTRVRKVIVEGHAEAAVLAGAGLARIGHEAPRTTLPHDAVLPAVGQGALAVAMRGDHTLAEKVRELLNDPAAERATRAERAMLGALEGGCRVPVGGYAVAEGRKVRLRGRVVSIDGALLYEAEGSGEDPESVGREVARDLSEQGAEVVLGEVRRARSGA